MRLMNDTGKGDFTDAFSPVLHTSGLRILLAIAPENDMFTDHVDISQAFTQRELQPDDGYLGNLYISSPPGFPEDPAYCYRLHKPRATSLWYAQCVQCLVPNHEHFPQTGSLYYSWIRGKYVENYCARS